MQSVGSEILINARQVTRYQQGASYEFILNTELYVLECVKVESLIRGIITPIKNTTQALDGMLFELNHVRVNPKLDNTMIIQCLTDALKEIGVFVSNPPYHNSMATCFKPLGEISDNVRFYLNREGNLVFLSPSMRLRLINCNKS
jgi:hypothetical protein